MARKLAFLHTAPLLVPLFNKLAQEKIPGAEVFHMVDESLIQNTIAAGSLSRTDTRRLIAMVASAGEAGADVVLVTCSSIGPAVDAATSLMDFPVLRVDEAMADEAVRAGARVGVAATLKTTLDPTIELIRRRAAAAGLERSIIPRLCEGAFEAVVAGDAERHDRLVAEGLRELAETVDVIALAQASMARVVEGLPEGALRVPVLSSPASGVERARLALESLEARG